MFKQNKLSNLTHNQNSSHIKEVMHSDLSGYSLS